MTFEVLQQHKLEDQLESTVYDWVLYSIKEQFGVEEFDELTREQIDSIYAYANAKDGHFAPYVQMCLISQCDDWYAEHPES